MKIMKLTSRIITETMSIFLISGAAWFITYVNMIMKAVCF